MHEYLRSQISPVISASPAASLGTDPSQTAQRKGDGRPRPMRRRTLVVIFAGTVLWLPAATADEAPAIETAQLDCDSLPPGPDRTDCYIGLARIKRQESAIAAGAAQRAKDVARYHQVTGRHRNAKPRAAKQKR